MAVLPVALRNPSAPDSNAYSPTFRGTPWRSARSGPRTGVAKPARALRSANRVALNAIKHGLSAPFYMRNLTDVGEATKPFGRLGRHLVAVLRHIAEMRLVRYAQMFWMLHRRR